MPSSTPGYIPPNILRGIVPTATLWDGQIGFAYQAKTGGTVFTDFTTAANNATGNDVNFFDATMQAQDAFYFGENFATSGPFNTIKITEGTAGNYAATGVWEYYDSVGTAWTAIPGVTDASNGFKVVGSSLTVTWPDIATMGHVAVNGQDRYWVRFRISAFTSLTTAPLGTQIWLGRYPASLVNTTDGDITTTSVGTVLAGAALASWITFDLGTSKNIMFSMNGYLWSSAGTVTVLVAIGSTAGATSNNLNLSSPMSITLASKPTILPSLAVLGTGRYIHIRIAIGGAGTMFTEIAEFKAYEMGA